MASRTFDIVVNLSVNAAIAGSRRLVDSFRRVEAGFQSIQRAAQATKRGLSDTFKAIGTLAATAVGSMTAVVAVFNKFSAQGDEIAKTADKLGITTEALTELRFAAELTGVSTQTLDTSLQRMTRRISEATQGTGVAVKALKELGIPLKEIASLSADEQFQRIATAMEGLDDQAQKVRLSMALFDTEGVALVNTLALGEEGLRKAAEEAEKLGITLDRVETAKLEQANDSMAKLGRLAQGAGRQFSVALAPAIEFVASLITDSAIEAGGFGTIMADVVDIGIRGFAKMADVLAAVKAIWPAIKSLALETFAVIIRKLADMNAAIVETFNKIPGVTLEASSSLSQFADATEEAAQRATNAFLDVDLRPSEKLLETYEKFKVASNEQAEATARQVQANQELSASTEVLIVDKEAEAAAEKELAEQRKSNLQLQREAEREAAKALREREAELREFERQQQKVFKNLGDSIGTWATTSSDAIQQVVGDLIQLIALQAFGGTNSNTGTFLGGFGSGFGGAFANGGNFSGGKPILVGEQGPELIVPRTSGTVIPNDQLGGGGLNISSNFVVNGSVNGVDDLESRLAMRDKQLARDIKQFMVRQKGFGGII